MSGYVCPRTFETKYDNCFDPAYGYFSIAIANFGPNMGFADLVGVIGNLNPYVYVLHGNGFGDFAHNCTSDRYLLSALRQVTPQAVATSSALNSGGTADIAVCAGDDTVVLLLGRGDGTFQYIPDDLTYTHSMGSGVLPAFIILPDLNNDGCADLVTANHTSQSISVRLNLNCNAY